VLDLWPGDAQPTEYRAPHALEREGADGVRNESAERGADERARGEAPCALRVGESERDEHTVDRTRHDRGLEERPRSHGRRRPAGFGEAVELREGANGDVRQTVAGTCTRASRFRLLQRCHGPSM
jgi:hypothetical protein